MWAKIGQRFWEIEKSGPDFVSLRKVVCIAYCLFSIIFLTVLLNLSKLALIKAVKIWERTIFLGMSGYHK